MEKENIISAEEKKNKEGRKCLEKIFFCGDEEKRRRYLGEENNFSWRKKQRRKWGKIFGEEKYISCGGEGKVREYLEKENMLFAGEKKNREGGENLVEKENVTMADPQTDVCLDRHTL